MLSSRDLYCHKDMEPEMTDLHAHADRIAPALDSACPDPGAADMACIATTKADAIIRPWSHDMVSLATVRDRACAEATASRLMDIRSAFSLLEKRLGVDLAAEPATAPALRRIFSSVEPARMCVWM